MVADRWLEVDGKILFYCGDKPVEETYFLASSVVGIRVEEENHDPKAWERMARENQIEEPYSRIGGLL